MGLWYTEMDKELSASSVTKVTSVTFWIYAIDMIQECLFMGLLLNDPSVIHKPVPYLGG